MKIILLAIAVITLSTSANFSSKDVLKKMHDRYTGKWYKTFSFVQTTENYRHDSLIRTSTWYEAIVFPDKFRMDFGDLKNGNAMINNKDSAYAFRNNKLIRTSVNDEELTFLLGGMYFYPLDTTLNRLPRSGYDLSKFHEDTWQGKPVYVIGADNNAEKTSQLWIDREKLILLRFINFKDNRKEEGVFENHKQLGGGWSETKCTFYFDDKLVQKEYYKECKVNEPVDPAVFSPTQFGKVHWYKGN
ncbi:MAG: hypothetical protein H0W12_02160 [Chitinophagaceae bacterium]|nr:hypothetical protein [Chitinophagaceae bacterium]